MSQHGHGDLLHVFDGHGKPPVHGGQGLAALDQELPGARAGAPVDQVLHELRRRNVLWPRRSNQAGHVLHYVLAHRHLAYQVLQVHDGLARKDLADLDLLAAGGLRQDPLFLRRGGVVDLDVEHEAVQLGLGQRVGAFLLDGVLRGDGEKRLRQGVGLLAHGHLTLLHGLEQGCLGLGRRAVDFVGQQDAGKDRSLDKAELPPALLVFLQHVRTGDIRWHQVGRKLDPLERDVQNPAPGCSPSRSWPDPARQPAGSGRG